MKRENVEEAHASFQHLTRFESLQPFKKINADLYEKPEGHFDMAQ